MSTRPLLNPAPADDTDYLREQVRELERQLRVQREEANREIRAARDEVFAEKRAYTKLRHTLEPWKQLLDTIFGELDAVGIESDVATHSARRVSPAWEGWKQRFPGKTAEMISVLLDSSGAMTRDQLRISMHSGWSTVDRSIKILRDAGLLLYDGRKYSLKQL